jgi:hypothetical protein
MVKTIIEEGLWDPVKEFSNRTHETIVKKKEKRRKRGVPA